MTDTAPPAVAVEHQVAAPHGTLHVTEHLGEGPPVVLTHGYPDDARSHDRLVAELSSRHVVTFDFLGHGRSGRGAVGPLEIGQREGELAAVIDALGLEDVVLVGHDAGGPVVVDYALTHRTRVSRLVLLNTYYGNAPTLEFPELIRMLADRHYTSLMDELLADQTVLGWFLFYIDRGLNDGANTPDGIGGTSILPQFFGDAGQPDAVAAIRAWTADLFPGLRRQDARIAAGDLATLDVPVALAFGIGDPYLNVGVGRHLQSLVPGAQLHEIAGAAHWPQWDQPAAVASIITAR